MVGCGVVVQLDVVLQMAAGDEQVAIAVVVEIDQSSSPIDVGEDLVPRTGRLA